ncbi:unnamed protein product, partial [Allacma fusca]
SSDFISSSRRLSAFVRPQQSRLNSTSTRHPLSSDHHNNVKSSLNPLLNPSSASNSSGEPFFPAAAILPYPHTGPMWASSNVFYHFALPPQPAALIPGGTSLGDLASSPVNYGGPIHFPPSSGCTIPGCRDCVLVARGIPEIATSSRSRSTSNESASPLSLENSVIDVDSIKGD